MGVTWITHRWYQLLEVDPQKLVVIALRQRAINPDKFPSLIARFQEGGEMDAPIVSRGYQKTICFADGIHRTILAAQLELPTMKIAVTPEEVDFIKAHIEHL